MCVHTPGRKNTSDAAELEEFRKIPKFSGKNTIFNEHPVCMLEQVNVAHLCEMVCEHVREQGWSIYAKNGLLACVQSCFGACVRARL